MYSLYSTSTCTCTDGTVPVHVPVHVRTSDVHAHHPRSLGMGTLRDTAAPGGSGQLPGTPKTTGTAQYYVHVRACTCTYEISVAATVPVVPVGAPI